MSRRTKYRQALAAGTPDMFTISFSQRLKNLETRSTQEKIVHWLTQDEKNYGFVCLTSFGKTIIDLLLVDYYLSLGYKKILVTAPTEELNIQIFQDFNNFYNFSEEEIVQLAGVGKTKRQQWWQNDNCRVYISTPHNVANDLARNVISSDYFQLIIIDEAHHGIKKFPYTDITARCHHHAKIIAQTAVPGTISDREQSAKALCLDGGWWTTSHAEQLAWQQPMERIIVEIPLDDWWQQTWKQMFDRTGMYYSELVDNFYQAGLEETVPSRFKLLSQKDTKDILRKIDELRKVDNLLGLKALHNFACVQKMLHLMRQIFQNSFEMFFSYYDRLNQGGNKSNIRLAKENKQLYLDVKHYCGWNQELKKPAKLHPKLLRLKELQEIFSTQQTAIYHSSIEMLQVASFYLTSWGNENNHLIGKTHVNLQRAKDRKKIRHEFNNRQDGILQISSVGSEGLHLKNLQNLIFYGQPNTPNFLANAEGRVGRDNPGKVWHLLFSQFDRAMYYANDYKREQMYEKIKVIPDVYVPNKKVKMHNIDATHLPKKIVDQNNSVIREIFFLQQVTITEIISKGKISGYKFIGKASKGEEIVNIIQVLTCNQKEEVVRLQSLCGKQIIVSGKVYVEDIFDYKIINIVVSDLTEKQGIIPV